MLLAVLVIQEQILVFIPQVQLTVILIIVYAQFLSYHMLAPLIVGYVLLDNLIMASFSIMYTPSMMIMWVLLGVIARMLRHKPDYTLFLWAVGFAFLYSWSFIPARLIEQSTTNVCLYLKADLIFEIILATNSVVTFQLFYQPLKKIFERIYKRHPDSLDAF